MKAMKALIVVDAQNEFSPQGHRPVPDHASALAAIRERVEEARREARPIAWVVDPEATGARGLDDERLGRQSADEVRRSAFLHLANMGAVLAPRVPAAAAIADAVAP